MHFTTSRYQPRDLFLTKQAYVPEGDPTGGSGGKTGTGRAYHPATGKSTGEPLRENTWMGLADKYAPVGVGAAGGGALGWGAGKLFGASPGVSAALGAGGTLLGGYLGNRYRQGHFKPLLDKGFWKADWSDLGKALWGGGKKA